MRFACGKSGFVPHAIGKTAHRSAVSSYGWNNRRHTCAARQKTNGDHQFVSLAKKGVRRRKFVPPRATSGPFLKFFISRNRAAANHEKPHHHRVVDHAALFTLNTTQRSISGVGGRASVADQFADQSPAACRRLDIVPWSPSVSSISNTALAVCAPVHTVGYASGVDKQLIRPPRRTTLYRQ